MKLHSLLSVTALALILASCSSSSPVDSDLDASSDTAIAEPLEDDENGTNESGVEGESDDSDIDEQTDENASVVESDIPDQTADIEDNGEENSNDNPDQNLDPENPDVTNEDLSENETEIDPVIDPDSSLGQLQSRVHLLTGESLLRLNEAISSGELLTEQQEDCIGAFDPALGEPLLAINCDDQLSISGVPIYASVAAFTDTPQCRASLQNGNADNCSVSQAQFTLNSLWTVPPAVVGQAQRPQPTAGATIQYAIESNTLLVENIDSAWSGVYSCEYDLSTGLSISAVGNCDLQFNNLVGLIDTRLADVI